MVSNETKNFLLGKDTLEINLLDYQKSDNISASRPSSIIYGHKSKDGTLLHSDTGSTMFTVTSFIIPTNWKQRRCPSTEERIKKLCHIYTIEYYSNVKTK